MSIQIGKYTAQGPYDNAAQLSNASGVYVILGRANDNHRWRVVDVGESETLRDRVENHDRAPCWRGQNHAQLTVAAIYCDAQRRMQIEKALRTEYTPPCGDI